MTTSGKNGGSETMLKTVLYLPEGARRHAAVIERLMEFGLSVTTPGDGARGACASWRARPFALCLVDLAAERPPLAAIRAIRGQQPQVSVAGLFDPGESADGGGRDECRRDRRAAVAVRGARRRDAAGQRPRPAARPDPGRDESDRGDATRWCRSRRRCSA